MPSVDHKEVAAYIASLHKQRASLVTALQKFMALPCFQVEKILSYREKYAVRKAREALADVREASGVKSCLNQQSKPAVATAAPSPTRS